MPTSIISETRMEFHATLLSGPLTRNDAGIPSNADRSSVLSTMLANGILDRVGPSLTAPKLPGQTAGADFESASAQFLKVCFQKLAHMRPGTWDIGTSKDAGLGRLGIAKFDQYSHLAALDSLAKQSPELASALGADYLIKPDVVVFRNPEPDEHFNANGAVVDADTARHTSLRQVNQSLPILHASISCKWTIRSDRAQNSRSEALNLVRNRKGRLPHISVITAEPMPSRIASIALGTGDIDCTYHFALYELIDAVKASSKEDSYDLLQVMMEGNRLKDISDLPIDLVI